jgi:SAM-dependent methyltransferase
MAGYVSDVAYTLGFYPELAPAHLNYVCAINGVAGIATTGPLRYCELGCGRGYGTALLAAANPDMQFVGIDFNPAHISEARTFAARAGIENVAFLELAFGDAAAQSDAELAPFDIVAMHGVYSWIAPAVREDIHQFFRAKLLPGGLAYISYNTMPGWAAAGPIQHLLKQYADRGVGNSLARIAKGREILNAFVEKNAAYIVQNPAIKSRLTQMQKQDEHYLVHEFLNSNWHPLFVTDAIAALGEAKLTYVGSANVAENRLVFAVPKDLAELVASAADPALAELLKDYAVNKQFRRDVYVKGAQQLRPRDAQAQFDAIAFARHRVPDPLPERWRIPTGQAKPSGTTVDLILSRLQTGPATGAELMQLGVEAKIPGAEVPMVLELLIYNNAVVTCRPDFASVDRSASDRLNHAVMELAWTGDTHRYLSAPALGSAIGTNFFERLAAPIFLGDPTLDDTTTAATVLERIEKSGRRFVREGQLVEPGEKSIEEMAKMVSDFRESTLPRWRDFGIIS